jgi:hypothetical protein
MLVEVAGDQVCDITAPKHSRGAAGSCTNKLPYDTFCFAAFAPLREI